ncbi:MAG TPA: VOC family protein [Pyrinomonadaceae bacterium]|nr:VOC family protein [Pyrinomonadaceae bacterium]
MLRDARIIYLFIYVADLEASRAFYEEKLGFRVLEEDANAVKYDGGEIILALNKGGDYGISTNDAHDDSSMIVFHVEDVDAMRSAMEGRGVAFFGATARYDIGATAVFYDPDGHCFCLYEPSEEALTWPSADKIRKILAANGTGPTSTGAPASQHSGAAASANGGLALGQRKMVYLFLFIKDVEESSKFYGQTLGLRAVEESPEVGVVKYDAGSIIIATHLIESEEGARATTEDLERPKSISPVFNVPDVEAAFAKLSQANIKFTTKPSRSKIGVVAQFEDPTGHVFYLYEPSPEALNWPSGSKIKQILAQPL